MPPQQAQATALEPLLDDGGTGGTIPLSSAYDAGETVESSAELSRNLPCQTISTKGHEQIRHCLLVQVRADNAEACWCVGDDAQERWLQSISRRR
jgi:hypothetical protein